MTKQLHDVAIVGGGFTGLTAAYALGMQGHKVCVVEAETTAGGLAGTFEFSDGVRLEKFYHHWFRSDTHVPALVAELGMDGEVLTLPSRTGMYFNGRVWKLSTPFDLLRFSALSWFDRMRLGLLVLRVRRITDWHSIEHLSVREWLEPLCGSTVYRIVWEPLLAAKFSMFADSVNAAWMWKKLVLRGGTRNHKGGEELAYFRGGFGRLADAMVNAIERSGGEVIFGDRIAGVETEADRLTALRTGSGELIRARRFLFTPALPIIADIFDGSADAAWLARLRRVRYLGNICLVLRLTKALSDTYWLNVNDPGFPFVGVIEHTNFDFPENYRGTHIAYLSRYLAVDDPLWSSGEEAYMEFALPHLKRMFPEFDRSWIVEHRTWRAHYAQPITERNYSHYVPGHETQFANAFIASMAHIYPEDRGTNYAIREGREIASRIHSTLVTS